MYSWWLLALLVFIAAIDCHDESQPHNDNDNISMALFSDLEELSRLNDISYCIYPEYLPAIPSCAPAKFPQAPASLPPAYPNPSPAGLAAPTSPNSSW